MTIRSSGVCESAAAPSACSLIFGSALHVVKHRNGREDGDAQNVDEVHQRLVQIHDGGGGGGGGEGRGGSGTATQHSRAQSAQSPARLGSSRHSSLLPPLHWCGMPIESAGMCARLGSGLCSSPSRLCSAVLSPLVGTGQHSRRNERRTNGEGAITATHNTHGEGSTAREQQGGQRRSEAKAATLIQATDRRGAYDNPK